MPQKLLSATRPFAVNPVAYGLFLELVNEHFLSAFLKTTYPFILARCIFPDILAFYESEEGQREFAEWKAQQAEKPDKEIAAQAAD